MSRRSGKTSKKLEKTSNKRGRNHDRLAWKAVLFAGRLSEKDVRGKSVQALARRRVTCPNRDGTCGDGAAFSAVRAAPVILPGTETNPSRNRSGSRNPSCSKSGRCISSSPISRRIRTRTRRWNIWKKFSGRQFGRGGRGPFDRNETGLLRGRGSFSVRRAEPDQTGSGWSWDCRRCMKKRHSISEGAIRFPVLNRQ